MSGANAAIGFTGMDFETAVRERIPILSVLLNNFSMAMELPIMPVSTERYRSTGHFLETMPRWRARSGVTASVSQNQLKLFPRSAGNRTNKKGVPALLEFITSKELTVLKAILRKK